MLIKEWWPASLYFVFTHYRETDSKQDLTNRIVHGHSIQELLQNINFDTDSNRDNNENCKEDCAGSVSAVLDNQQPVEVREAWPDFCISVYSNLTYIHIFYRNNMKMFIFTFSSFGNFYNNRAEMSQTLPCVNAQWQ